MLLAGFICSIVSIEQKTDLMTFTTRLLLVLVIFYMIGAIIRVIFDKAFTAMSDKKEEPAESDTDTEDAKDTKESENVETDSN